MLEENFSTDRIREAEESSEGFPRAVWEEGAKLGWPGVLVPEEIGGGGGGLLDACVLLEEIGRAGATLPLVVGSGVGDDPGRLAAQERIAIGCSPRSHPGRSSLAALIDEQSRNEWDEVRLPITADGDDHVLSGKKILVPFGSVADELLVTAVTPSGEVALVVVDPNAEGVSITRHHSQIGVPLSSVEFSDVRVPDERVIHRGEDARVALRAGLQAGSLLATAEAVG